MIFDFFHRHKWKLHLELAQGTISKRDCDVDRIVIPGRVERCEGCQVMRLVPLAPGLNTAIIEEGS